MELNDTSDYQRCFACGQRNSHGLHLVFRQEDDTIVTDFQPREEHQGFPGVLHGGVVATVLDEVLSRSSLIASRPAWSMTGRLEIRYRRPVPYGPLLRARASLLQERGHLVQASGVLTLAQDERIVFAEAKGAFMELKVETLDEMMKEYPGMRTFLEQQSNS